MSDDRPSILGINHLGIAAKDPKRASWFLSEILGLKDLGSEVVQEQHVNTIMFESASEGAEPKSGRLEILEPTSDESPIQKYLDRKGGGIHHIAFTVADVAATLDFLKSKDIRLIDETPRNGAHNTKIGFVHPAATGGLLVEFVQESHH